MNCTCGCHFCYRWGKESCECTGWSDGDEAMVMFCARCRGVGHVAADCRFHLDRALAAVEDFHLMGVHAGPRLADLDQHDLWLDPDLVEADLGELLALVEGHGLAFEVMPLSNQLHVRVWRRG